MFIYHNFFRNSATRLDDFVQNKFIYREPRRLSVMLDKKLWLIVDDHKQGETLKVQLGTYEFSED